MKTKINDQESRGTATKEVKSTKENQNRCNICDYTTSNRSDVKRHFEAVHEGKKPHKCSICNKSFSKKSSLKTHVESVHERKKQEKCSICNYSCLLKATLKI